MSRSRLSARVIGICFLCSSFIFFFLDARSGYAQDSSTGAIRGTVLDPDGGFIAGATVAIANAATGQRYVATTDVNGQFSADLLPPGDYSARIEIQGFSPQVAPQEHLEVGGTLQWQFRLRLAGALS